MADFTLAQIGETSGGASPQPGVQQPNPVTSALSFASGVGQSLFESMGNRQEAEAQEQANKAVTRFSEQQMRIADLVDRGEMSSQEGRMRMRRNLITAGGDNPNLAGEFGKAHEAVVTTAGMGKVAAEGTEQEQAFMKEQAEALRLGFFQEGASEEEARAGTQRLIRLNRDRLKSELAKEELAMLQAQQTYARGQIGMQRDRVSLASSQLQLRKLKLEQEVQEGVVGMADSYFPVFSNRMKMIQARAQDPSDPMQADEAALLMRQELDGAISEARARGATMDPSVLTNILTPYQRLYDTSREVLTGKMSGEVFDEISSSMTARTGLMQLTQDADTLALVSTSNLLGSSAGPLLQSESGDITKSALNIFKENAREDGKSSNIFREGEAGIKSYLDFLSTGISRVVNGSPSVDPEGEADELRVQTNSLLKGVADNAGGEEFRRVKPVIDHIASDNYASYITSKGRGAINKEYESDVELYLSNLFNDEIEPLIAEEWRNASTQLSAERMGPGPDQQTEEEATSSLIQPMFTGDGVRFVKTNRAGDNPRVDAEMQRLNRKVAPAVNTFLRAGAHLQETTDYERLFNERYSYMFGNPGSGAAASE